MKCGYNNCKLGGEVSKEKGVKSGARWFHKECLKEKELKAEIEIYWLEYINRGTVLQLLRKAINDLVKLYEADYILWSVKSCKTKNIRITHPMGLKSICSDNRFLDEWNKIKINKEYEKIKDEITMQTSKEVSFKYVPSRKKVTDII